MPRWWAPAAISPASCGSSSNGAAAGSAAARTGFLRCSSPWTGWCRHSTSSIRPYWSSTQRARAPGRRAGSRPAAHAPCDRRVRGESPGDRARLAAALGCPVRNVYAASEFTPSPTAAAAGCTSTATGSSWSRSTRTTGPTPPGDPSHTVLLDQSCQPGTADHPLRPRRLRARPARPVPMRQPVARHPGRWPARRRPPAPRRRRTHRAGPTARDRRASWTKRRGCTAASSSRPGRRRSGFDSTRNPGRMPAGVGRRRREAAGLPGRAGAGQRRRRPRGGATGTAGPSGKFRQVIARLPG